jgi:hypothetical protein
MGLDQYLSARAYVSGYEHRPIDEQNTYEEMLNLAGFTKADLPKDASPFIELEISAGYWRKANQVHNWFVQNVQEGEDDCKPYFVSRERLAELLSICREVQADHSKAKELLPVSEGGFFFGSYEYDNWYFEQVENTIAQLAKILNNPKFDECDFSYRASW